MFDSIPIFAALLFGASPSGKAAVFGSAIRWFDPSRPSTDHQPE